MKRIATTISITAVITLACDVADGDGNQSSRSAELVDDVGIPNAVTDGSEGRSEEVIDPAQADRAGLASRIDAEPNGAPAPTGSNRSDAPHEQHAVGSGRLSARPHPLLSTDGFDASDCGFFLTNEFSNAYTRTTCANGYRPISGGCWTNTSAHLVNSFLDEGSNNGPDLADPWSVGLGWSCEYSAAPTGGNKHIVWALCCLGL